MKKIVFITPQDARYGFSLTGVRQLTLVEEEVEKMLLETVEDPETGVVVIDERLVEGLSHERFREMELRWPGLIMVLPAPSKAELAGEDYALRLIRRAIGYQIRLSL